MKVCLKCNQTKPASEFSKRSRASDGLQSWCRPCKRGYDNQLYRTDPERRRLRKQRQIASREDWRSKMIAFLGDKSCVDCGESDMVVLEFDHVHGDKKVAVTLMHYNSWAKTLEEIAKCEIVCANCHRRRTARRGNHYRVVAQLG